MPQPLVPWLRRRRPALLKLLHLLLPSHCALCGAGCDGVVCPPCQAQFCQAARQRCARCGNPLRTADAAICAVCESHPPSYDATVFAVDYAPPLDHLVLQLKFSARLPLAPWCAGLLRDAVLARPGLPLPELICPVPLGPSRLVERGYNQALEIARPLADALGVALHPRLALRQVETRAQSGTSPHERAENIRGAFAIADPGLVQDRHVGIVDDVMTSGHTLEELAATFKRFGAARVTNLVFARTPPRA